VPSLRKAAQVDAGPHRPDPRLAEVVGAVRGMFAAQALGHEHLDGPAEHLAASVAEELLGLGVDQDDPPLLVHDHHRVRGRLEQPPELRLRLLAIKSRRGQR